ncbi:MAG: PilT/PilU family type 4a pilus ATPase [Vicinamibacteria bacterium]|jgi:twitching motility protein PilT|nr:PilT/PilU family type 4a pilus ATPase [Vicinamibacteria bacterium]MBP9946618.1 PilT/PilU family type 4a pilus ATPase [Vicinamibacteria bacterium]
MPYFELDPLLNKMLDFAPGISDLNMSVGRPPQVELDGQLKGVDYMGIDKLSPYQTEQIAMRLIGGKRDVADKLVKTGSTDCSYSLSGRTRFRVNIFAQRGTFCVVMRVIPSKIPTIEQLGIPPVLGDIAHERNGIVLVTGPTGSGKSTTLAAIINKMNLEKSMHIITIEDPIEYLHPHHKSTINQREVGTDTQTFALALRAALRQAPKVILVGEMRDVETISIALEASETGHLVLSTLHTIDAAKTIERIVGVFPRSDERQVRTRFSAAFRWVVSQRLVPKIGGGRIGVCEILRSTSRTREYVLEGERDGKSLHDAMEDGQLDGMQTFDNELYRLINEGIVDRELALSYATNRTNLQLKLDTQGVGGDKAEEEAKEQKGTKSTMGAKAPPPGKKGAAPSKTDMDDLLER